MPRSALRTQVANEADVGRGAGPAREPGLPRARRGQQPPSANAALDQRIRLLTAELGLSELQQAGVRAALLAQRQQTLQVWQGNDVAAPVRIKLTQDIATHTANRIRGLLTDEQREKYIKARPGEAAGASGEDAEAWLGRMRPH